jgi:hypothetical protein
MSSSPRGHGPYPACGIEVPDRADLDERAPHDVANEATRESSARGSFVLAATMLGKGKTGARCRKPSIVEQNVLFG